MKSNIKSSIVFSLFLSISLLFCAFTGSKFNTTEATGMLAGKGVKVCPGSGNSCILWGLVYKGPDKGHIEPIRDEDEVENSEGTTD